MKEKLTMIELFSGIGAQKRGIDLTELFDCEVIATSDIDKEATVSYAAIHNGLTEELINTYENYLSEEEMKKELIDKNIGIDLKKGTNPIARLKGKRLKRYWLAMVLSNNLGDVSGIKQLQYADFWTYSFPCQDISVAGKQAGIKKGETRSSLLFEVERLLEIAQKTNTLPKYLLLENVKNLVGKKHKPDFDEWLNRLEELGFNTYWQVINGKDCGIPQNRERAFAISIRKDIDTGKFEFNKPFDNGLRLRDLLDEVVDEKYYISEDKLDRFITDLNSKTALMYDSCQVKREGKSREYNEYSPTLNSRDYKDPRLINENNIKQLGNYRVSTGKFDNPQTGRVYSIEGIAPTLNTMQGGDRQPKILEDFYSNRDVRQYEEYSPTLRSERNGLKVVESNERRIRKLIPTECFRLMGFTDKDIKLCMGMGISDSQLYKQAGNSIITYCIMLLMEQLYKAQYDNTYICTDERILNGDVELINFTQPQVD